jgi:hypothetical protein
MLLDAWFEDGQTTASRTGKMFWRTLESDLLSDTGSSMPESYCGVKEKTDKELITDQLSIKSAAAQNDLYVCVFST